MSRKQSLIFTLVLTLLLVSVLASCGTTASSTQASTTSAPTTTNQPQTSSAPAYTTAPSITTGTALAKPQGELVAALSSFGNENFLPWLDPGSAPLHDLVYDLLIYYDHINRTFIPGLAESWEVSQDGLTLTYHLRQAVQWQDGWGEFTSADVKYNFEMHASSRSIGKTAACRRIASMDTPDPYTLVVHFKDPFPTFFVELSVGNSGICQGVVSKKYVETVGEEAASLKPIGTSPYRMVEGRSGDYFKFEALDSHWRVVPEFKTLTVRMIPETSSLVAALKNKEIDLALVPAQQLTDLKSAGLAVELSATGGNLLVASMGGMVIPEDKRYDPTYHNKDPWVDPRVRKAMAISIDRESICKAIYSGYAKPVGVPVISTDMDKYKYPYDQAAARQLLKDAGYPDGFSFRVISYKLVGVSETPQIAEALAGYWQQIGLDPKITVIDYNTYNAKNIHPCKTAGDISFFANATVADSLGRAELSMMPNAVSVIFEDEGSYAIYKEAPKNATIEERTACMDKLNQYYFDNVGPIPVVLAGYCYAWNSDKICPWPHPESSKPTYFEYVRHAQSLKTFRLFNPWPDR